MSVRDIIPWSRRGRSQAPARRNESGHPMFALQSDINQALEDFWRTFEMPMLRGLSDDNMDMDLAKVDVRDTDDAVEVAAELPGMEEKDIDVSVTDGALVIRGEKEEEKEEGDEGYLVRERRFGAFERVVPLPENLEYDAAEATFRNGVLNIRIPKQAGKESGRRRVSIRRSEGRGGEGRDERGARS